MVNMIFGHASRKIISLPNCFLNVADDEQEDEEGETVINIVDAHRLNEMTLKKADCVAMIKALLKRTVEWLKENGKEDRVAGFKAGATELTKLVVGKFDEMQIFLGESIDSEASMCFSYTKDGETEPVFLYFADCMKEEKY